MFGRMRRGMVATVVLALVATLLGGCTGGNGEEPPAPTLSRSASPSPSAAPPTSEPSPTASPEETSFDASVPPVPPASLEGPPTKAAASEVAQYFLALYPYMRATGDFAAWDALSGSPCDYCSNARKMVVAERQDGARGVGGRLEFGQIETFDSRTHEYAVAVHFTEYPSRLVGPGGKVVEENRKTSRVVADMLVVWDGGWKVDSAVVDLLGQS